MSFQVEAWDGPITLAVMVRTDNVFENIRNVEAQVKGFEYTVYSF